MLTFNILNSLWWIQWRIRQTAFWRSWLIERKKSIVLPSPTTFCPYLHFYWVSDLPKWLFKPDMRWYRKTKPLPCDSNMSWPGKWDCFWTQNSLCVSLFAWTFDLPQQISTILSNSWPTLVQRWPANLFVYGPACYWRGFTERCLSTWGLTFWPHSSMPLSLVSLRWLSRCVEGHVRDLSLSPL